LNTSETNILLCNNSPYIVAMQMD